MPTVQKPLTLYAMVERVMPHVIKIETPEKSGTGFLAARDENNIFLITADHVIRHAHDWRVPIKVSRGGEACVVEHSSRAISRRPDLDAATIWLKPVLEGLPSLPSAPLDIVPPDSSVRAGVQVGWLGYTFGHSEPLLYVGHVAGHDASGNLYFVDGTVVPGSSGGPVFFYSVTQKRLCIMGCVSEYWASRKDGSTLPGVGIFRDVTGLVAGHRGVLQERRRQMEGH